MEPKKTVRVNRNNDLKYREGLDEETDEELTEDTDEKKPELEYFTE